jgi:hypothetical protein
MLMHSTGFWHFGLGAFFIFIIFLIQVFVLIETIIDVCLDADVCFELSEYLCLYSLGGVV